ncbi:hypothetical protein AVEN_198854-1, partial [Araneus ventricosus]
IKPRSNGLSFHEFRPRFVLFPVVGTGRIGADRELVSASAVSRVMAVNSPHIKGRRSGQTASVLVDCGRWNLNSRAIHTARGSANISAALN